MTAEARVAGGRGYEIVPSSVPEDLKVFVLGDSRTGTTSLHRFFEALGLRSIHWYVDRIEGKPNSRRKRWESCRSFIRESGYQAFSDFPTRVFFRELVDEFPDAHFILSVRKDIETWTASMARYFGQRNRPLDLDRLQRSHPRVNDRIREHCARKGVKFLEITIDGDNEASSQAIKRFLNIASPVQLGWENRSATRS